MCNYVLQKWMHSHELQLNSIEKSIRATYHIVAFNELSFWHVLRLFPPQ